MTIQCADCINQDICKLLPFVYDILDEELLSPDKIRVRDHLDITASCKHYNYCENELVQPCDFCNILSIGIGSTIQLEEGVVKFSEDNKLIICSHGHYSRMSIKFCPMCGRKLGD